MKTRLVSILTALCLISGSMVSLAADKSPGASGSTSAEFLREAIHGNLAEVKLGQLAQQKSQSDAVRSMGAMLEKDHGKANRAALQVAQQLAVSPPTEPTAEQRAVYDRLAKLSGKEFDQQFIEEAVKAHQKTIERFEKQQTRTNDATASYVKETLPTVRQHLQMAQDLQSKQVPTS